MNSNLIGFLRCMKQENNKSSDSGYILGKCIDDSKEISVESAPIFSLFSTAAQVVLWKLNLDSYVKY
jgi:hypothetical protein